METRSRQNILGVAFNTINLDLALFQIQQWIETFSNNYVCVAPAHSVMDCYQDPKLLKIFNSSGMTTPDGMAIVWLLRLYGHKNVDRVYGPDLLMNVCQFGVEKKWRHFFYGGSEEVLEKLTNKLIKDIPDLEVAGTYSPPYKELSPEEKTAIASIIRNTEPNIVWVGIGAPKQEIWMAEFVEKLNVSVLIGVGAAFDFLSGAKRQAPIWIQRSGLEWLFRFISEPKRLLPRYILYPKFVYLALSQYLGLIKFDPEV